jgi:hypothetical protein
MATVITPCGGGGGGGIQFDQVNTGGWLEIRTTDTNEEGIYIQDDSGNAIELKTTNGGYIDLRSNGDGFWRGSEALSFSVGNGKTFSVLLSTVGSKFDLYDRNGALLLRVTEDGTYHIRTGASWVADL